MVINVYNRHAVYISSWPPQLAIQVSLALDQCETQTGTVLALVLGFGAVKHLVDVAVDVCWQRCPLPLSQAFGLTQFYSRLEGAPM